MKKRRLVIALFLIVATLTLSIGYAALVDELTITGTAGVSKDDAQETFDGDIYFSKAISGEGCTAEILEDIDKGEITVTAGSLKEVGDEVIATYTIKSENDLAVTVTPNVSNGNSTYFDVTTSLTGPQTLAAGSTLDVTVTIKLIKTAAEDQSTSFTVTFGVESIDA